MEYKLSAPLSKEDAAKLRAGDTVLLSGPIYTARDLSLIHISEPTRP